MKKEFIPYEQALALKELGFDEPCLSAFFENKIKRCDNTKNSTSDYISAILYQQAFRWFREKYGLISYIHPFALLEDKGTWCYEITDFSNNWDESFNIHSPEEAELECLKKLIEIVKK